MIAVRFSIIAGETKQRDHGYQQIHGPLRWIENTGHYLMKFRLLLLSHC